MKKTVVFILAILIQSVLLSNNWFLLDSEEGNFSIEFPAEPEMKIEKGNDEFSSKSVYSYELKDNRTTYYVSTSFMTDSIENIKAFLQSKVDRYPELWNAEKQEVLELNIDGNPGFEIDLKLGYSKSMRARLFVKDNRFYELVVVMPTSRINTSDINIFMNSLKIKE